MLVPDPAERARILPRKLSDLRRVRPDVRHGARLRRTPRQDSVMGLGVSRSCRRRRLRPSPRRGVGTATVGSSNSTKRFDTPTAGTSSPLEFSGQPRSTVTGLGFQIARASPRHPGPRAARASGGRSSTDHATSTIKGLQVRGETVCRDQRRLSDDVAGTRARPDHAGNDAGQAYSAPGGGMFMQSNVKRRTLSASATRLTPHRQRAPCRSVFDLCASA